MPDPRNILNPDHEPVLYVGELIDTAVADSDRVRARIPVIAEDFTTAPMEWDPRADDRKPHKDDRCLVAIDDQGGEWLLSFRPK